MLRYGQGNGIRIVYGALQGLYDIDALRPPHTVKTYFKRYCSNKASWIPLPFSAEDEDQVLILTDIGALAASLGTPVEAGTANAALTGITLASTTGTVSIIVSSNTGVTITGINIQSDIGAGIVSGTANSALTGVQGASALGTPVEAGTAQTVLSGMDIVSSTGSVAVIATINATVVSGRPKVISIEEFLGAQNVWDSWIYPIEKKEVVNSDVEIIPCPEIHCSVGVISATTSARCKIVPIKRLYFDGPGSPSVFIDYREKMKKQEEEFIRFLLAA